MKSKIDRATLELMSASGISFEIYYEQPGESTCADYLGVDEVEAYLRNPIEFASRRLGLTVKQYLAWVESGGFARCGYIRKDGRRCKNGVYGCHGPLRYAEWEAADGGYCKLHGGELEAPREINSRKRPSPK